MTAISAVACILAAQLCLMGESVRKETADGRIHFETAAVLEWYYGSCLACFYSVSINRAAAPETATTQL